MKNKFFRGILFCLLLSMISFIGSANAVITPVGDVWNMEQNVMMNGGLSIHSDSIQTVTGAGTTISNDTALVQYSVSGAVNQALPSVASAVNLLPNQIQCHVDIAGNVQLNTITLNPFGSETINGELSYDLDNNWGSVCLMVNAGADGWIIQSDGIGKNISLETIQILDNVGTTGSLSNESYIIPAGTTDSGFLYGKTNNFLDQNDGNLATAVGYGFTDIFAKQSNFTTDEAYLRRFIDATSLGTITDLYLNSYGSESTAGTTTNLVGQYFLNATGGNAPTNYFVADYASEWLSNATVKVRSGATPYYIPLSTSSTVFTPATGASFADTVVSGAQTLNTKTLTVTNTASNSGQHIVDYNHFVWNGSEVLASTGGYPLAINQTGIELAPTASKTANTIFGDLQILTTNANVSAIDTYVGYGLLPTFNAATTVSTYAFLYAGDDSGSGTFTNQYFAVLESDWINAGDTSFHILANNNDRYVPYSTTEDKYTFAQPTLVASGTDDFGIALTQTLNNNAAGGSDVYRAHKTTLTFTDATGWDEIYLNDYIVGATSALNFGYDTGDINIGAGLGDVYVLPLNGKFGIEMVSEGAVGGILELALTTTSPADGNVVGTIQAFSTDSGDNDTIYGNITLEIQDPTHTSEESITRFNVLQGAGASTEYMRLDGTDAITSVVFGTHLRLAELTTPTALADYGALYTKSDNMLYFQDGAGNEKALATSDSNYAGMYFNANGTATVLETASTPIMIRTMSQGSLNGWTYVAGVTAGITAYADYSGTVAGTVLATSTHGLTTGDYISIRGTTNYNGIFQITVVDGTHFYFTDTWVADDGASDFDRGGYLLAGSGAAGEYEVIWDMSVSEAGGAGSTVLFAPYKNGSAIDSARNQRKFANNDVGAIPGHGIVAIAAADRIYMTANSSGTNNITISYGNITINRL